LDFDFIRIQLVPLSHQYLDNRPHLCVKRKKKQKKSTKNVLAFDIRENISCIVVVYFFTSRTSFALAKNRLLYLQACLFLKVANIDIIF
jgi:hypothetical protein